MSNINLLVSLMFEDISPSYTFDNSDKEYGLDSNHEIGSLSIVYRKGKYDRKKLKQKHPVFDEEDTDGNLPENRPHKGQDQDNTVDF